eukprot:scaffold3356_cov112-Isochrysis_galbana.AAC.2
MSRIAADTPCRCTTVSTRLECSACSSSRRCSRSDASMDGSGRAPTRPASLERGTGHRPASWHAPVSAVSSRDACTAHIHLTTFSTSCIRCSWRSASCVVGCSRPSACSDSACARVAIATASSCFPPPRKDSATPSSEPTVASRACKILMLPARESAGPVRLKPAWMDAGNGDPSAPACSGVPGSAAALAPAVGRGPTIRSLSPGTWWMASVYASEKALFVFQKSRTDTGMLTATGREKSVKPPNNSRSCCCCCASADEALALAGMARMMRARAEPVDSTGSR